ncbi:anti-CBASS protein Acb1 family protein [Stenotrophomonas tuberculopleuritidis]|uniref:anti-CBASS protein Acb1 family protein n=1 Tax=Stenotrophomonas tuberculopleuritidis TaxID=3055079 RepID=UPI0026E57015|nr:anti-CBASS Acb1 family protein [Stenotrophomonas sp. 704A1]
MGKLAQIKDGLVNLVANLGTPRDKAASTFYGIPTLSEQEADNAYRGTWLARKVIDIPAMDSCRKWRGWSADQANITAIEGEEKRLGLQQKLLEALIRARLTGGAALYIGTGHSDPMLPLKPESLGKAGIRHLNVLSKRVLQAGELDRDPESPGYGRPAFYTLSSGTAGQLQIHPSRLVILQGAVRPDPELDTSNGWGDSVLLAISKAIKDADASAANIASLVFEAKVDVIKIPNFMAQLADPGYEEKVLNRLQLAAMAKGINGTLVMDAEENYDQKQLQFGGLVDLLMGFMQLVSGASDIPMTRLLGQSPGGLNASGESDLRNYYDRISSNQELVLQPALQVLDECLIRSALGSRPAEVFYNWRSLWQTTDNERAGIGKTTAETIKTISETRLLPDEVMSTVAVNMLTEAGVAPGLEAEMLKYGEATPQSDEQDDDEQRAAATPVKDAQPRSLYVSRKVVNADEIAAWAKEQGIGELQHDLHVTVAYSRQAFDWIKAGNANEWSNGGKDELAIPEGGPRAVEPLGGMSAVILFASAQLCWRHESIIRAGGSHDYPDYTPHISLTKATVDLSKVEPYRGRIVLGPEIFEEIRED